MSKIVIWGLRSDLHSHKFIHRSFFENFQALGLETIWVDDREQNVSYVKKEDTVLAVDVASKFLPKIKGVKYVLHNISPALLELENKFLNIQVHTNSSSGENLGLPYVSWDSDRRILFQPWGVPAQPKYWLKFNSVQKRKEFWIGSIWNNAQNQGNSVFMQGYRSALKRNKISLVQKGTTTRIHPNGMSEIKAMSLVNKSAIGSAVVGNWQKDNGYIPCRLFKNIASGALPISNANFRELFGENGGIFESNPELLIEKALSLSNAIKMKMNSDAQNAILPYTYAENIRRILKFLEE
jgi:hypothetical protein